MYLKEKIESIEDLINKLEPEVIQLHLDSNICIYLREFYREPSKTVSDAVLWNELKNLLKHIKQYDIEVDLTLGVEESCRNLDNFEINKDKVKEALNNIGALFDMDFLQIIEHSKLIQFSEPAKDTSQRQSSKMASLNQPSSFQNLMFLSYACLLKLYLIYNDTTEPSNSKKMINYLDFLSNDVDLMSVAHISYGNLLLSGYPGAKDLIHPRKKTIEHIIHGIWNASIDLSFPTLVSGALISDKKVSVFVTRDELLWKIFDSMKLRFMFTNGDKSVHPPMMELDYSNFKWSEDEIDEIHKYHNKIQEERRFKFILSPESNEARLDRLRRLCFTLENNVKNYLKEQKGLN